MSKCQIFSYFVMGGRRGAQETETLVQVFSPYPKHVLLLLLSKQALLLWKDIAVPNNTVAKGET